MFFEQNIRQLDQTSQEAPGSTYVKDILFESPIILDFDAGVRIPLGLLIMPCGALAHTTQHRHNVQITKITGEISLLISKLNFPLLLRNRLITIGTNAILI